MSEWVRRYCLGLLNGWMDISFFIPCSRSCFSSLFDRDVFDSAFGLGNYFFFFFFFFFFIIRFFLNSFTLHNACIDLILLHDLVWLAYPFPFPFPFPDIHSK